MCVCVCGYCVQEWVTVAVDAAASICLTVAPHNSYFAHLMWLNLYSFLLALWTAQLTIINYFYDCFAIFLDISAIFHYKLAVAQLLFSGINVFTCEYVERQKHYYLFIWLRWNAWTCSSLEMESHDYFYIMRRFGGWFIRPQCKRATLINSSYTSYRFDLFLFTVHWYWTHFLSLSLFCFMYFIRSRVQPHLNMFTGRRMIVW